MERLFGECKFYLYFFSPNVRDELAKVITSNGGKLIATFNREVMGATSTNTVTHFLTTEQKLLESSYQIKQAEKLGIPVLPPQWVYESIQAKKLLAFGNFVCVVSKQLPLLKKPSIAFTKVGI
jgi:hypothetical protein